MHKIYSFHKYSSIAMNAFSLRNIYLDVLAFQSCIGTKILFKKFLDHLVTNLQKIRLTQLSSEYENTIRFLVFDIYSDIIKTLQVSTHKDPKNKFHCSKSRFY